MIKVMAERGNPSGLPVRPAPVSPNQMSRALDQRPTTATALSGFAGYILGMLLVMGSVFALIGGLAMLVDGAWGSWLGRVAGVGVMSVGVGVFALGRWLMQECAVQRRSPKTDSKH